MKKTRIELVQRYLSTTLNRLQLSQEHLFREILEYQEYSNNVEANVTIPLSGTRDCDQTELEDPKILILLLEEIPKRVKTLENLVQTYNELYKSTL